MEHKVLPTGLHCIIDGKRVSVYTEKEYQHLEWWKRVKINFNLKIKKN